MNRVSGEALDAVVGELMRLRAEGKADDPEGLLDRAVGLGVALARGIRGFP